MPLSMDVRRAQIIARTLAKGIANLESPSPDPGRTAGFARIVQKLWRAYRGLPDDYTEQRLADICAAQGGFWQSQAKRLEESEKREAMSSSVDAAIHYVKLDLPEIADRIELARSAIEALIKAHATNPRSGRARAVDLVAAARARLWKALGLKPFNEINFRRQQARRRKKARELRNGGRVKS